MTERHSPLRRPLPGGIAPWHLIESTHERVVAGHAVEATTIDTYGSVSSAEPEGH